MKSVLSDFLCHLVTYLNAHKNPGAGQIGY